MTRMRNSKRARLVIAGVSLLVPPAVILWSWLAWRDSLPSEVASHWSDLGDADGSIPTTGVFVFAIILSSVAAGVGLVICALPQVSARVKRGALFWVGLVLGLAAGIWLVPAWLTLQAGSAEEAVLGAWIIPLIACFLYGVVPYGIAPRPEIGAESHPGRILLAPTEVGAWSRTITGAVFVWVTLILIVLGAVIYGSAITAGRIAENVFGLIVMGLVILLVASFISFRVTVDWRGLRVVSLPLRIPLKRIPLHRIQAVQAADLHPTEWGGWGYRILPGRSALILRKGPGLIVTTANQKQFALTLEEPEIPAALLNTLRDASEVPRPAAEGKAE